MQHRRARARICPIGSLEAIDLFAGAGGLSLGLEAAGFVSAAAVESVPDACATYRSTHPGAKVFEADISTVDFKAMRGCFALVAGGPPCQPFSIGGKRLAADDPRNGIPQFLRALGELRPEAFIMENVAGMAAGCPAAVPARRNGPDGTAGVRDNVAGARSGGLRGAPETSPPVRRGHNERQALQLPATQLWLVRSAGFTVRPAR